MIILASGILSLTQIRHCPPDGMSEIRIKLFVTASNEMQSPLLRRSSIVFKLNHLSWNFLTTAKTSLLVQQLYGVLPLIFFAETSAPFLMKKHAITASFEYHVFFISKSLIS